MEKNIDVLIATKVMKWIQIKGTPTFMNEKGELMTDFKPSINIQDAFMVLDNICYKHNCSPVIYKNIGFSEVNLKTQLGVYLNYCGIANSLKMAICQMALTTVGIIITTDK